mmetsp:Transcript_22929/g.43082  ORF Transcript_22929/g.43082 Transcript_22929/m.43082 type:complete len:80 (-) Transcript_22929:602-841(-)
MEFILSPETAIFYGCFKKRNRRVFPKIKWMLAFFIFYFNRVGVGFINRSEDVAPKGTVLTDVVQWNPTTHVLLLESTRI